MTWLLAAVVVGLVVLVLGAEMLVRGSSALALRFGISPLVVGLTVVAFGTSSPELVISLHAAFEGKGDLTVGNVVGSNICNIALILGVSALISPIDIHIRVLRRELPILVGASGLLWLFLLDRYLGRFDAALLTAGLAAFLFYSIREERKKQKLPDEFEDTVVELADPRRNRALDGVFVVAGLVCLILGADWLVDGAVGIAKRFDVSEAVIGLTIIAVGTSLPELATSVVAALKKEGDLSVGNAVGSSILNILGILGPTALIRPIRAQGLKNLDLAVMLGLSILILPLMRRGMVLNRWEGGFLVVAYCGYLYSLIP